MIRYLPLYISVVFIFVTIFTLVLFHLVLKRTSIKAVAAQATTIVAGLLVWLVAQAIISLSDVYNTDTVSLPPKIVLFGILPDIIGILLLFVLAGGKRFVDSLSLKSLTWVHIVRVPVELVLYLLFVNETIPQLMTFEGRNFDIVAGITAPLVIYVGWKNGKPRKQLLLIWNIVCLVLLLNIVVHAFLSAPSRLQQLAFDQPNIAILYFPFSWLPTFIVPIVLFCHLAAIRQLIYLDPERSRNAR